METLNGLISFLLVAGSFLLIAGAGILVRKLWEKRRDSGDIAI